MKVKVIEVDATKLDPNAAYLIVFNSLDISDIQMRYIIDQLNGLKVRAVYAEAPNPKTALKVYQIPQTKEGASK